MYHIWNTAKFKSRSSKFTRDHRRIALNLADSGLSALPAKFTSLDREKIGSLNISGNNFSELPDGVVLCTNIVELILKQNPLKLVPDSIGQLRFLEELRADWCCLKTITAKISNCTKLKQLHLTGNTQLRTLPVSLFDCEEIVVLFVRGCPLSYLPPQVGKLSCLRELNAGGVGLTKFPIEVTNCNQLIKLWLDHNAINTLPPELYDLTKLIYLNLSNNRIKHVAPGFKKLQQIKEIYLYSNSIEDVPVDIIECKQLTVLNLSHNPLRIPSSILNESERPQDILVYLRDVAKSHGVFNVRCNVMVVGDGEAGKTSLIQTMLKGHPQPTYNADRTQVLVRKQWQRNHSSGNSRQLDVRIYDFGGNSCYDATTKLYFIENSIFIITFDFRKHNTVMFKQRIQFWLEYVSALIPRANILLVGTHSDLLPKSQIPTILKNVNSFVHREEHMQNVQLRRELKNTQREIQVCRLQSEDIVHLVDKENRLKCIKKARPDIVQNAFAVSSVTFAGMEDLSKCIIATLEDKAVFPEIQIPLTWQKLAQTIENTQGTMADHWLSMDEVRVLSKDIGLDEESLTLTLDYLRLCGDILWFKESNMLKRKIFHKPDALTDIFKNIICHDLEHKISNGEGVLMNKPSSQIFHIRCDLNQTGTLTKETLKCILRANNFRESDLIVLIDLLVWFNIGYLIPDTGYVYNIESATAVRLPMFVNTPRPRNLKWPRRPTPQECHVTVMIVFNRWCPPSVYFSIAVKLNKHIKERIDWKNGMFAVKGDNKLLLEIENKEDHDSIVLSVRGTDLVNVWIFICPLLHEMKKALEQWPGLVYTQVVLCPVCVERGATEPGYFPDTWLDKLCPEQYLRCVKHFSAVEDHIPVDVIYPPLKVFKELVGRYHQEKVQFLRYSFLINECAAERIRRVFLSHIENLGYTFHKWLESNKHNIDQTTVNQPNYIYQALYPSTGDTVDIESLDIITFMFIFTKVLTDFDTPVNGWDYIPEDSDLSVPADILRIGILHNEPYLSHNPTFALSDQDFQAKWTEAEGIILRLGGDKEMIGRIKSAPVDSDLRRSTVHEDK